MDQKLVISQYNDKCYAIFGNTKPHANTLLEMGGVYNKNLKGKPGWIFRTSMKDKIVSYVERVNGEHPTITSLDVSTTFSSPPLSSSMLTSKQTSMTPKILTYMNAFDKSLAELRSHMQNIIILYEESQKEKVDEEKILAKDMPKENSILANDDENNEDIKPPPRLLRRNAIPPI